jgi:hypothetical protein
MQYRHVVFTALALAALLAFWSCKQPMEPPKEEPPYNEPDTANSYVRAVINGRLWEVRSHDTVSVGGYAANGQFVAASPIVTGFSSTCRTLNGFTTMSFSFEKLSNIQVRDFIDKEEKQRILRTWQSQYLLFQFQGSTFSVAPYNPNTFQSFTWSDLFMGEQYLPSETRGGVTSWNIYSLRQNVLSEVNYASHLLNDTTSTFFQSNAIVERASLTISSYREKPNRMSGRFSFRLRHPLTGEVIDIKEGTFDNVQFIKSVR